MRVRQAYRFALRPTPGQERALRSHAGAARSRGTGAWRSAGSGMQPRAGGTRPPGCTSCGMRRRRPTRRWRGGGRTPSAPTRRRSATLTGRYATSSGRSRDSAAAAGSGSRGSRSGAGAGTRSGSPPGRCAARAGRSPYLGWAPSPRTSPPASSPAGWTTGRRGSCRPPCPAPPSAGSSRSPSRWSAPSRGGTPGPAAQSASTWASGPC